MVIRMKRKIAFHLNCLEQGGAERVVSNLANRFAKEGYEVLLATEWYGENEFQIDREVRRVHVGLTAGYFDCICPEGELSCAYGCARHKDSGNDFHSDGSRRAL